MFFGRSAKILLSDHDFYLPYLFSSIESTFFEHLNSFERDLPKQRGEKCPK